MVGKAEAGGQRAGERLGVGPRGRARLEGVGEQLRVRPERHTVGAPVHAELPAGQGLAGVPLALAGVQQGAGGELLGQPAA